MRLFQQSGISTATRFLLVFSICTGTAAGNLLDNTLATGENLFTAAPASVMAAGAVSSFLVYRVENTAGNPGFMPGSTFKTVDIVDNFVFGEFLPISSVAVWLGGMAAGSDNVESFGEEMCRGLLYTYGTVQTLKMITRRERPDGSNNWSFPSGHTAGASCAAAVVWNRYGAAAGIPLSALTLYTCLSRINLGRHFPSDVIMGVAIGTACGIASSMVNSGHDTGGVTFSLSVDSEGRITPGLW